jgi:hypothetical protein
MFESFVFSTVSQRDNYEKLFLIKEVGLPLFALPVRAWRDNIFTGIWIRRGGQFPC